MRIAAAILCLAAACAPAWAALRPECELPPRTHAPFAAAPSTAGLRVGVALGSGSTHGLAHIGVIQELEARGLKVDVVAGTSVGALIGALWASGYTGRQIEALSEGSHWDHFGRLALSWQGLLDNDRLRAQLEKLLSGRPIESWPRRFGAVATHVASGERRILSKGDGAAAVQASTAVPVLFMPVTIGKEQLADGALVEPVPVGAARALGADYVIAVDVAYRPREEEASGITQFAFQAMHILINSLAEEQLRGADVALRMELHKRFMECGGAALIASGRGAVERAWPEIERSLSRAAQRKPPGR